MASSKQVWLLVVLLTLPAVLATTSAGQFELDGQFIQGGLVFGKTLPGSEVLLNGRTVRVSPAGQFLLGFGRTADPTATLEVRLPDGSVESRELEIAQREYQVQRIDGLPPKMVTPSEEDLERIRADQALINAARNRDTPSTYFNSGFEWPALGVISGVYGSQRILNGQARQPHYGVDIAAPQGTPVHAPADGVVSLVRDDMYYTGGTIMIDHGHGLSSAFLHLSRIHVQELQGVKRGDLIGEIGATGRATGPHLDWRINLYSTRVDAQLLVSPLPAVGDE